MMDWDECRKRGLVKEVRPDSALISSLTKSSAKKLESERLLPLNATTAASKITLAYDAVRELMEAVALKQGYKIYNHECYCALFKEVLERSGLGDEFDSFRRIRNAVNYYGKDVPPTEAGVLVGRMRAFAAKIGAAFF